MRDDIHRYLPLRRGWQSFMRCCRSLAEFDADGCRLYENAMRTELRQLARGNVVEGLTAEFQERQPGLPGMHLGSRLAEKADSPEHDLLVRHAERFSRLHYPHAPRMEDVLASVISEMCGSVRRHFEATVLERDARSRVGWMERFDAAAGERSTDSYARAVLDARLQRVPRPPLDMDAGLVLGPEVRGQP